MELESRILVFKQLKSLAESLGMFYNSEEIKRSDYMETEYQQPDILVGLVLLKNILNDIQIDYETREDEKKYEDQPLEI